MNLNPIKANMTELEINGMRILFSYKTPVAMTENMPEGRYFYRTEKKWSATTTRHINSWLPKDQAVERPQEFFDTLLSNVTTKDSRGCAEFCECKKAEGKL